MDINAKKNDFQKIVTHVREDLNSVRTNRLTPSIIENLKVEVYGAKMLLNQIANISVPEPKQLLVEPWDKTIIKNIEKDIETASLGFSVKNEGNILRLTMPPLTEETRQKMIKVIKEKSEAGRVSLRGLRDKIKEEINSAEKNKEISEDEKYQLIEKLDQLTRDFTEEINKFSQQKEGETAL
ncbi:MAG TPA: ribosome-recycling factor [bacterium]|nr:ribosome-recycling factor [bacterium]HPL95629.1 ribosome-recycling factor [bacterium]